MRGSDSVLVKRLLPVSLKGEISSVKVSAVRTSARGRFPSSFWTGLGGGTFHVGRRRLCNQSSKASFLWERNTWRQRSSSREKVGGRAPLSGLVPARLWGAWVPVGSLGRASAWASPGWARLSRKHPGPCACTPLSGVSPGTSLLRPGLRGLGAAGCPPGVVPWTKKEVPLLQPRP